MFLPLKKNHFLTNSTFFKAKRLKLKNISLKNKLFKITPSLFLFFKKISKKKKKYLQGNFYLFINFK